MRRCRCRDLAEARLVLTDDLIRESLRRGKAALRAKALDRDAGSRRADAETPKPNRARRRPPGPRRPAQAEGRRRTRPRQRREAQPQTPEKE